ncbi:MAG: hypothetical protein M1834_003451 [Cirrosporium novae-zelandiae]|nr:MAG: hypothetical protein M1834_003451 [Cirrosporium novae-zelandiae]
MATQKNMRRADLGGSLSINVIIEYIMLKYSIVIPYVEPSKDESKSDLSGTMSSTLPMAAMFTRNKSIAWAAVFVSLQNWLGETAEQKKGSSTPGYFGFGMSIMSVVVCLRNLQTYLPLFLPPPANRRVTATEAPGPITLP